MASRNSRKIYLEGGYYHVYNRGVEKREIFKDGQDYSVFLRYLAEYLMPKDEKNLLLSLSDPNLKWREKDRIRKLLRLNNFFNRIHLLAYCLMPNHFHFFVKQKDAMDIDCFMNSIFTRYVGYFNKKYNRIGHLFQDEYKAKLITHEDQFIYLSKYIHRQALFDSQGHPLKMSQPSSYVDYINNDPSPWLHLEEVLEYFSKNETQEDYAKFIANSDSNDVEEFMNN